MRFRMEVLESFDIHEAMPFTARLIEWLGQDKRPAVGKVGGVVVLESGPPGVIFGTGAGKDTCLLCGGGFADGAVLKMGQGGSLFHGECRP